MATHGSFDNQFSSLQNVMRTKYAKEFPGKDIDIFDRYFAGQRILADGGGRRASHSYEVRRFLAEKATWIYFWPGPEFPGIPARSTAVMNSSNGGTHGYVQVGNGSYRGQRGAYGGRGGRGRGIPRGSRGGRDGMGFFSGGPGYHRAGARGSFNGSGVGQRDPVTVVSSIEQNQRLTSNLEGQLIDFNDDAIKVLEPSSIVAIDIQAANHVSEISNQTLGAISSRETVKEERKEGFPGSNVTPAADAEGKVTNATASKQAAGRLEWEEHDYNISVRQSTPRAAAGLTPASTPTTQIRTTPTPNFRSLAYPPYALNSVQGATVHAVEAITSGLKVNKLESNVMVKGAKTDEEAQLEPEKEQWLIEL